MQVPPTEIEVERARAKAAVVSSSPFTTAVFEAMHAITSNAPSEYTIRWTVRGVIRTHFREVCRPSLPAIH
eukprot:6193368-Pleurochrysis_carterae.AAC.1